MYTAKARMLSFDFLNDDVVRKLPAKQVMLLAGMIARADNLGRLPGEPAVLMAHLFTPKEPRGDVMPDDVEALLYSLANARRVHWYAVGGTRFVQFTRWEKNQPGLRAHNRKSILPGPTDAGSVSVALPFANEELFTQAEAKPVVLDPHAAASAARKQADAQRAALDFPRDAVAQWIVYHDHGAAPPMGNAGDWVKFAQWLFKTGTHHAATLLALLDEVAMRRPATPYAYLAKGSEVRESIEMRINMAAADAEHQRIKREERGLKP